MKLQTVCYVMERESKREEEGEGKRNEEREGGGEVYGEPMTYLQV